MSKSAVFELYAQVHLSEEEQNSVRTYKIGDEVVYNSEAAAKHLAAGAASGIVGGLARLALAKMSLNITINSLTQGQTVKCSTLEEVITAEDAVKNACANVRTYLDIAATFDGREEIYNYDHQYEQQYVEQQ